MQQATLTNVAERAGVHPSTASRALNPETAVGVSPATRQRVEEAAAELGYQVDLVARGLRRRRSSTIGIVVAELGNPFITPVIHGVVNSIEDKGFMGLIAETQEDESRLQRIMRHLTSRRVDAIVVAAGRVSQTDIREHLGGRPTPIVLVVRDIPGSGLPAVVNDDHAGARMALEHLHDLGHRVVMQLEGPRDVYSFVKRSTSFAGASAERAMNLVDVGECAAASTVEEGKRLLRSALRRGGPRPTGIFAHNDLLAIGALAAIAEAGLDCPADISVVGYNDAQLTEYVDPPLTTVRMPAWDIGRIAGEMALRLMDSGEGATADSVSLPPSLIVRRSTAPV